MTTRPPRQPPLTGRTDSHEGPFALRFHDVMTPWLAEEAQPPGNVLLGFCCDEGVRRNQGRVGASEGPASFRAALGSLAVHYPSPLYDGGDVVINGDDLPSAQYELSRLVGELIGRHHRPLVVGGGHEVAYGTWGGIRGALSNTRHAQARLGVINLDAHFDLRRSNEPTSGTPFLQIAQDSHTTGLPFSYLCLGINRQANTQAVFQTAQELGVTWVSDRDLQVGFPPKVHQFIRDSDLLYLSLDLDVLPAHVMPAVSSPATLGVPLGIIEEIIDEILGSQKLIAADIAELNPNYDIDHRGARVAARLGAQLLQLEPIALPL